MREIGDQTPEDARETEAVMGRKGKKNFFNHYQFFL